MALNKRSHSLWILAVSCIALGACGKSGDGVDDAIDVCDEACEVLDECHEHPDSGPFAERDCRAICAEVDPEDNFDPGCDEELAKLFECVSDANCGTLLFHLDFEEIDTMRDLILQTHDFTGCEHQGQQAYDDCQAEFDLPAVD